MQAVAQEYTGALWAESPAPAEPFHMDRARMLLALWQHLQQHSWHWGHHPATVTGTGDHPHGHLALEHGLQLSLLPHIWLWELKTLIPVPKKRTNIGAAQEVQGLTMTTDPREGKKYLYIFVTSSNSTNNHAVTLDLVKRHYYLMWQQRHVQHASTMPWGKACMTKRIL